MIIAEPGHYYFLDEGHSAQPVHFHRKACPQEKPEMHLLGELRGGTTANEVLDMLIDRLTYLQEDDARWEHSRTLQLLWQAKAVMDLKHGKRPCPPVFIDEPQAVAAGDSGTLEPAEMQSIPHATFNTPLHRIP